MSPLPTHATRRTSAFSEWLDNAQPHDHFLYHRGHLAVDRGPEERRDPTINPLANAVWAAQENGLVILTQQRFGAGNWNYLAIRTKRS
jgi:hypothetical protein